MDTYSKSNSITTIPNLKISNASKTLYNQFRNLTEITSSQLQALLNSICIDIGVFSPPVLFEGKQPHKNEGKRLKCKTLGIIRYTLSPLRIKNIQVYRYTAKQNKQITPKTAIDALLHELDHLIDLVKLGFIDSLHTKGFFLRLKNLKDSLA